MSLLADSTSMLPGCLVASIYPGLGAPAAAIIAASSGGESGAGPLVGLGLIDGTDYYWTVTSLPARGTLQIYEDGSFSHTGAADGSWPWSANVYADGVLAYTLTITDTVGTVSVATTLVQDLQALLQTLAPAGGVWYAVNTTEPPVYPYIVWQRVASNPLVAMSGPADLQNTRIQVDIYSRQVSEMVSIEGALEALFNAASLVNVPLSSQDIYEPDTRAMRAMKDYSVWARN